MIYALLKAYFWLLFGISTCAVAIFAFGIYLIFRMEKKPITQQNTPTLNVRLIHDNTQSFPEPDTASADVTAIAGDDIFHTQLDLAQAFVHTGNLQEAEKILVQVAAAGNSAQRAEADNLLLQIEQERKTSFDTQPSSAKWTSLETENSRKLWRE